MFTDIDPEITEGKMILKDRFLTQLAPYICHKLWKQAFGPNQSLEKLLQLAQTVYYDREYEKENKREKRTRQKTEAPTMAVRPALKQPEKNAQRDPGEKGWACYYCGVEGHLKWNCPQASMLPQAPCPVCKGPHWRRDCPLRCKPQGSDSLDNQDQRCPGVTTQAPILITPEEPRVLITVVGQPVNFILDPRAAFSLLTEAPGPLLSEQAKCYYFSHPLSCNWDSELFFSQVSNHARVSLTPSGERYTEQSPGLFSWIWNPLF